MIQTFEYQNQAPVGLTVSLKDAPEKPADPAETLRYLNEIGRYTKQIQTLISNRDQWYVFDESTGVFSWEKSLARLCALLKPSIDEATTQQIQEIIERCFNQQALLKTSATSFAEALLAIDDHFVLWSEGDLIWQNRKLQLTGLNQMPIEKRLIEKEKTQALQSIISEIQSRAVQENEQAPPDKITIVIIDDKNKNLQLDPQLQTWIGEQKNLAVKTFLIDLNDPAKNCLACLNFLQNLSQEQKIYLIVDMDGVLLNTKNVLREKAAPMIARFLAKRNLKLQA